MKANGIKLNQTATFLNDMSKNLCAIQYGTDLAISKLQIQDSIRTEIGHMVFAVSSCREGSFILSYILNDYQNDRYFPK